MQKDITDVMSFQLHVDMYIKYILNHFQLLEIMIIKSTYLRVKDLVYFFKVEKHQKILTLPSATINIF